MIVKDFIKWLETQDQEAIVEILVHSGVGSYCMQGGECFAYDFDPENTEHWDYTDFRNNPYIRPDSESYNKRFLQIGTMNN